MTKENYMIELRKRLSLLDSEEIDKIIVSALNNFDQLVESGHSEGLALEQMGNVNDYAEKILQSYHLSNQYIKLFIGKEKVIDEINEISEKLVDASATVYIKIEETVSDFARTTGHIATNVYQETIKFGEEKINQVKKIMKKRKQNEDKPHSDEESKL